MMYKKKPVVIEAFKLGADPMPDWFVDAITENKIILHGTSRGFYNGNDTNADIETLEGRMHANYGDYIIRGVKGEIYPCKPDIFRQTYDAVKEGTEDACNKRKLLALKFAYQILTDKRNRGKYSSMFIFSEKSGIEMYFGDMLDTLNDIAKDLKEGGASDA